jgi:carbon storage regulator
MVVISRKRNEALVIGDNIIVTVVEIRGDKVRLGIEHPPEVPVHRQEVLASIQAWSTPTPADPPAPTLPPRDSTDRFIAILEVN